MRLCTLILADTGASASYPAPRTRSSPGLEILEGGEWAQTVRGRPDAWAEADGTGAAAERPPLPAHLAAAHSLSRPPSNLPSLIPNRRQMPHNSRTRILQATGIRSWQADPTSIVNQSPYLFHSRTHHQRGPHTHTAQVTIAWVTFIGIAITASDSDRQPPGRTTPFS